MKKIVNILVFLCSFIISAQESENESSWTKRAGIIVAPKGSLSLQEVDKGLSGSVNLLLTAGIARDRDIISLAYTTGNHVSFVYQRAFSSDYGAYSVVTKSVLDKGGYFGAGITRSVGNTALFIEAGNLWNIWSPSLSVGIFIPVTFAF